MSNEDNNIKDTTNLLHTDAQMMVQENEPNKEQFTNNEVKQEARPNLKIKEVKYGMSVLVNLGDFENIRTHIEVTAEIGDNADLSSCVHELRKQVIQIGRKEYKEVKQKKLNKKNK